MDFRDLEIRSILGWFLGAFAFAVFGALIWGAVGFVIAGGLGGFLGLAATSLKKPVLVEAARWSLCSVLTGFAGFVLGGFYSGFVSTVAGWVFCPLYGGVNSLFLVVVSLAGAGLGWGLGEWAGSVICGTSCGYIFSILVGSFGGFLGLRLWSRSGVGCLISGLTMGLIFWTVALAFGYLDFHRFDGFGVQSLIIDAGIIFGCLIYTVVGERIVRMFEKIGLSQRFTLL